MKIKYRTGGKDHVFYLNAPRHTGVETYYLKHLIHLPGNSIVTLISVTPYNDLFHKKPFPNSRKVKLITGQTFHIKGGFSKYHSHIQEGTKLCQ